jgi:hypothetical protein
MPLAARGENASDPHSIDSKAFTADQAFGHASPHDGLEQMTEKIAVTEAPMPIAREGRVVGHLTVEPQLAEME